MMIFEVFSNLNDSVILWFSHCGTCLGAHSPSQHESPLPSPCSVHLGCQLIAFLCRFSWCQTTTSLALPARSCSSIRGQRLAVARARCTREDSSQLSAEPERACSEVCNLRVTPAATASPSAVPSACLPACRPEPCSCPAGTGPFSAGLGSAYALARLCGVGWTW